MSDVVTLLDRCWRLKLLYLRWINCFSLCCYMTLLQPIRWCIVVYFCFLVNLLIHSWRPPLLIIVILVCQLAELLVDVLHDLLAPIPAKRVKCTTRNLVVAGCANQHVKVCVDSNLRVSTIDTRFEPRRCLSQSVQSLDIPFSVLLIGLNIETEHYRNGCVVVYGANFSDFFLRVRLVLVGLITRDRNDEEIDVRMHVHEVSRSNSIQLLGHHLATSDADLPANKGRDPAKALNHLLLLLAVLAIVDTDVSNLSLSNRKLTKVKRWCIFHVSLHLFLVVIISWCAARLSHD